MKMVQVIIDPQTGVAQIETSGFAGKGCKEATAALEAAFGGAASDVLKPEYAHGGAVQQQVRATK